MKCEVCKKNEATVFLTTVEGQSLTKLCLCTACAASKGVSKENLSIPTLSSLMGGAVPVPVPHSVWEKGMAAMMSGEGPVCDACGLTMMDFKKSGRLGCVRCYEVFRENLSELLEGMHQGTEHLGKVARGFNQGQVLNREIEHLKKALSTAIRSEHYEEAARLRDRIQELENRLLDAPEA